MGVLVMYLYVRVCPVQVNPEVVPELEKHGLHFVGQDESQERMEIMELTGGVGRRDGRGRSG